MTVHEEYATENFRKLSDREHVRARYGMYIGDNGQNGLHHLAEEVINNCVDEVCCGQASRIEVTIHLDGSISVEDDGRGIPVDRHPEESDRLEREVSALEVVMTQLGRKIGAWPFKASSGIHGVGLKAVNFLSSWCEVTVWRDGSEFRLRFEKGEVVGPVQRMGPASKHGTRITFKADLEIFERNPQFDYERLHRRMRELAYLYPGLIARIHDERTTELRYDRGISELVESLTWYTRSPLHNDAIRVQAQYTDSQLDIAILFTGAGSELIQTYVNSNLLPEGGTPVTGLKKGISRALHHFARKNELTGDVHPTGDDLRQGLTAVIAARVAEPQFAGPLRLKIANPQLDALTDSAVYEYLKKYLADHPDTAERIWKQGLLAARRRTNEEHAMSD